MKNGFLHFKNNLKKYLLAGVLATMLTSCAHTPRVDPALLKNLPTTVLSSAEYANKRMLEAGISPEFAAQIYEKFSTPKANSTTREKIIYLNVFGFLARGNYSLHYSENALKKVSAFMHEYRKPLKEAETKYKVSKEVLAALLWVETKHGKHTGTFELPEVYFSLLQASHPLIAENTLSELRNRQPAAIQANPQFTERSLQEKVVERSIKKSDWALEQLKAMDTLFQKGFKSILQLKASFAGAFGYCQFIPKTYQNFAISEKQGATPDLFNMNDAILSVAHYLSDRGWKESNPKAQSDALFEYNRIRDYGDVILKIAGEVRKVNDEKKSTHSKTL